MTCSRSILLFNHQTFFDWGFIWNFLKFFDCDGCTCIILKKSLRYVHSSKVRKITTRNIPILGFVMENAGFCFLERDWKRDEDNIAQFWNHHFCHENDSRMLIMFPEGTTRDISTCIALHCIFLIRSPTCL